jgi:hypothetical protein
MPVMKAESFGIPQNSREIITHYNYNNLIPCGKGNELNNYLGYGRFREKNEQYSEQYHLSRKKDRIEILAMLRRVIKLDMPYECITKIIPLKKLR